MKTRCLPALQLGESLKDRELINGALLGLRCRLWLRKTILDTVLVSAPFCSVCLVCFQLIFPFLLSESAEGATLLQNYDGTNAQIGAEDHGWFYSASRQQQSTLRSDSIHREAVYGREQPMNRDLVPIRQKAMVKNYFLDLHESEKK